MRIVACIGAVIALAPAASAQMRPMPVVVAGGGFAAASDDGDSRMAARLNVQERVGVWLLHAAVRVAPRISLGGELFQPGVARAVTRGRSFQSFGEQRERAVLAIVRMRAAAHGRFALDVAGGAGVMFQHHQASFAPCFSGCDVSSVSTLDNTAAAFAAGVEVPIRIARHFEVAALGRYYFLGRGEHLPDGPRDPLPWQFEYRSSARLAIGGGGRVVW